MLFVLWNVAHYSIIAVAFIRNGFFLFFYIVFIYSIDARARLSYFGACARPLPALPVSGLSVQAPPNSLHGITATGQKYFYIIKRLNFICISSEMLYLCTKLYLLCLLLMIQKKRKTLSVCVSVCLRAFLFCSFLFGLLLLLYWLLYSINITLNCVTI